VENGRQSRLTAHNPRAAWPVYENADPGTSSSRGPEVNSRKPLEPSWTRSP
jgi:hypothetical protein